ncbi:ATP-binding cassette domain-containing protein, partial [Vibrio parahaemolyticus]|nr:ATP-binding cassette domain-containing protein [Vibrio parahaemolyticus]
TKGSVYLKGRDIAHISENELREVRRNNISMVFQSFALMPHMTVIENAAFGLELAGIDVNERQKSALSALERVGLDPYAESFPDEL